MSDSEGTQAEWEAAVARSYRASVTADEYETKATAEAIRKVAYYMRNSGYALEYLNETSDSDENGHAILFMDFAAMTNDI